MAINAVGRFTLKESLNKMSEDLKNGPLLGDRLERLERQTAWHGLQDTTNRNTIKNLDTLPQCIAVANALKLAINLHFLVGAPTHKAADATNIIAAAAATDLATLLTLLIEEKADFNAHRVLATAHDPGSTTGVGNSATSAAMHDKTNIILSADPTTLATAQVTLMEIQTKYRLHTFRGALAIDEEFYI